MTSGTGWVQQLFIVSRQLVQACANCLAATPSSIIAATIASANRTERKIGFPSAAGDRRHLEEASTFGGTYMPEIDSPLRTGAGAERTSRMLPHRPIMWRGTKTLAMKSLAPVEILR